MKDWMRRLATAVTEHVKALAQVMRNELPGHLMAAVVVEAVILGHLGWASMGLFLLVVVLLRRR